MELMLRVIITLVSLMAGLIVFTIFWENGKEKLKAKCNIGYLFLLISALGAGMVIFALCFFQRPITIP